MVALTEEELPAGIESQEKLEESLDALRDTRRPLRTGLGGPRMFVYQLEYDGETHDFRAIHIKHPADFKMVLGEVSDVNEAWVLNHIDGKPAFGHGHLFEEPREMEKQILEVIQRDEPYYCECDDPEELVAGDQRKCMNCMRKIPASSRKTGEGEE